MTFPDITPDLKSRMPDLRGRLLANQPLAELTWFRVGGPAQVLFMPEDESDLAYLLKNLPAGIPAIVIGLGSNLIIRDGGVPGVVIRLGRGFNDIKVEGQRIRAGTSVRDDELEELAKLVLQVDDKANVKQLTGHDPRTQRSLLTVFRSLIGLDAAAGGVAC